MKTLEGRIALVAGATRGAGRGIACALGEAGATVYCTGRSVRGRPPTAGVYAGRPETIEETAEMVTARGGEGVAARVDHLDEAQVASLAERLRAERGRLDILVNDISEGVLHEWKPFWQLSLERGFEALRNGVQTHVITCRHLVPLMLAARRGAAGLVVEIGDGHTLGYRRNLFYDLVKTCVTRLAYAMAEELLPRGVAAVAVTPGYMRTEYALAHFGVAESNWRDAAARDPNFLASESPFYVGRAVAALAADPRLLEKSGGLYSSWGLAEEYGFTDINGTRPNLARHFGRALNPDPKTAFRWTIEKKKTTNKTGEDAGASGQTVASKKATGETTGETARGKKIGSKIVKEKNADGKTAAGPAERQSRKKR
jgi:NAD(P)-dependent dehydrogenase (short-subunit alcohol dehydrogenase family)